MIVPCERFARLGPETLVYSSSAAAGSRVDGVPIDILVLLLHRLFPGGVTSRRGTNSLPIRRPAVTKL